MIMLPSVSSHRRRIFLLICVIACAIIAAHLLVTSTAAQDGDESSSTAVDDSSSSSTADDASSSTDSSTIADSSTAADSSTTDISSTADESSSTASDSSTADDSSSSTATDSSTADSSTTDSSTTDSSTTDSSTADASSSTADSSTTDSSTTDSSSADSSTADSSTATDSSTVDASSSSGANDTSSTVDMSSSTGDFNMSSTGSSNSTNSTSSSSTGEPIQGSTGYVGNTTHNGTQIDFGYYTCGQKYVTNDTTGHYFNGRPWHAINSSLSDYLDIPNEGPPIPRGYPQCYGKTDTTENCLDNFASSPDFPERKFCGNGSADAVFTRGEVSPSICIIVSGGIRMHRVEFHPLVDQFALLQAVDSFAGFAGDLAHGIADQSALALAAFGHWGTAFQIEVNGVVSEVRHRYGLVTSLESVFTKNPDGSVNSTAIPGGKMCTIVPFHTIVVKMTRGIVDAIEFDDDDTLCDTAYSVDGNCANKVTECTATSVFTSTSSVTSNTTDCDFKVYISWQGTDSEGTFLTSSGRRLSQFRRWSLSSAYNQASSFDTGELPAVEPANPDGL